MAEKPGLGEQVLKLHRQLRTEEERAALQECVRHLNGPVKERFWHIPNIGSGLLVIIGNVPYDGKPIAIYTGYDKKPESARAVVTETIREVGFTGPVVVAEFNGQYYERIENLPSYLQGDPAKVDSKAATKVLPAIQPAYSN